MEYDEIHINMLGSERIFYFYFMGTFLYPRSKCQFCTFLITIYRFSKLSELHVNNIGKNRIFL